MTKNQLVPSGSHNKCDAVEIIVKTPLEDKSKHQNNNTVDIAANVVGRNNEDSLENGREEHVTHMHYKGKEGEGEEEVIARNASHAT